LKKERPGNDGNPIKENAREREGSKELRVQFEVEVIELDLVWVRQKQIEWNEGDWENKNGHTNHRYGGEEGERFRGFFWGYHAEDVFVRR